MKEVKEKPMWQSKSVWFGVLTAAAPLIASITGFDLQPLLTESPNLIAGLWGGLAFILRLITKDEIKLRK